MDAFFTQVDKQQDHFVDRLAKAVAIPSISSDVSRRPDVFKMAQWLKNQAESLGVTMMERDVGKHIMDGTELQLPPILLGQYGTDSKKKTVLVYGHYDVQPALKEDGWNTDPWTLTEDKKTGRMYGRGSTDDKGPILGWLNVIEAHQKAQVEFPVNLKMCFEGMEENGSEGLDDLIIKESNEFFKDVDVVCISDNYWLGTTKPCITYGLRGVSYFKLVIEGPGQDLHSGVFGGTVEEPMGLLIHLMSKLVTPKGEILIPGIMDSVAPVTENEKSIYENINFTMDELHSAVGAKNSTFDNKEQTLMARWRFPSLSLHGIEGAFSAPGAKTVIPAKVTGKFSIRTVPNQEPDEITKVVGAYLDQEFAKLNSKCKLEFSCLHAGKWWYTNPDHPNYVAAAQAVEEVYKVQPDLTREGGSIPVTLTFQDALGKNVLLLPMGKGDDGAHSINEKLELESYIQGTKLLGAYLHKVAAAL